MLSSLFRFWLNRQSLASRRRPARIVARRRPRPVIETLEAQLGAQPDPGDHHGRQRLRFAAKCHQHCQRQLGTDHRVRHRFRRPDDHDCLGIPAIKASDTTINGTGEDIILRGASSGQATWDGLTIKNASGCVIEDLTIRGFADGITITGSGATGNLVEDCYIGTNDTGNAAEPNTYDGIQILAGASNNTIGGTTTSLENLLSGNGYSGIYLSGSGTSGNVIQNNIIGLNLGDTKPLANGIDGVDVQGGASGNTIGGTTSTLANWLSGNTDHGVYLGGSGTSGNVVIGNLIGTDGTGSTPEPNGGDGIAIWTGATNNTIGGTASGDANVISGNDFEGVSLYATGTTNNVVIGNIIGLNKAGNTGMANGDEGIFINTGAADNTIGGTLAADRNVISGNYHNDGVGLKYSGTTGNVVEGNYIGTDITGTTAIGNGVGVDVGTAASDNQIGPGNVISGNYSSGVFLRNSGTTDNTVIGNLIGLDATGKNQLDNGGSGISIGDGSMGNTIGGTASGMPTSSRATTTMACTSTAPRRRATSCWATPSASMKRGRKRLPMGTPATARPMAAASRSVAAATVTPSAGRRSRART